MFKRGLTYDLIKNFKNNTLYILGVRMSHVSCGTINKNSNTYLSNVNIELEFYLIVYLQLI